MVARPARGPSHRVGTLGALLAVALSVFFAAAPVAGAVTRPLRGWSQALGIRCIPSTGTVKVPCVLIDFPDYPAQATAEQLGALLDGPGDPASFPMESVAPYYERSSYGRLQLQFDVLGVYRSPVARDSIDASDRTYQAWLVEKALRHYAAQGHDFGQYDADRNGEIDFVVVLWGGPAGADWWPSFGGVPANGRIDGLKLGDVAWSTEPLGADGKASCYAGNLIHEVGHALGLPDLYDSQPDVGPPGGVGGWDIMGSGGECDHGALSKIMLGWITPQVVSSGSQVVTLRPSSRFPDAAIVMPRYSTEAPRREFFIVQARDYSENDEFYMYRTGGMGLQVWHVDAVDEVDWGGFAYNNSDTSHKLLRMMEADGLEDIANLRWDLSGADLYRAGQSFGPGTVPSSRPYWGTTSGVSVTDIVQVGDSMQCTLTAGTNDLDLTPPVTRAVVRYDRAGHLASLSLKASDKLATWTRYKVGASKWQRWDGGTWDFGRGSRTVYFYSMDRAGNLERLRHVDIVVR